MTTSIENFKKNIGARKIISFGFIFFITLICNCIFTLMAKAEYASPAWMDNEHIICVKYADTVKSRMWGWLGDITGARNIVTKEEIQIVSMDINGENEKIIKNIIIDYPGMSPKWREEAFEWVQRIGGFSYNQNRELIAFGTNNDLIFIINLGGEIVKKILGPVGGFRFSPDGKYLQYTSNYKVWLYDLDTGEQKVLIDNALSGPWSPDGKKIVFSREDKNKLGQYDLYFYDFETKIEEHPEGLNKAGVDVLEDWSPDGRMITTPSGAVYSLRGEYLKIPSDVTPSNAKWSPDGKHIVGNAPSVEGYIIVVDNGGSNRKILR